MSDLLGRSVGVLCLLYTGFTEYKGIWSLSFD